MNTCIETSWIDEDTREHFPCLREWWCIEGFLKTEKEKKIISLKLGFTQWVDKGELPGSNFSMTLIDVDDKLIYRHYSSNKTKKLEENGKEFKINYEESYLRGSYPQYTLKLVDTTHDIELDLTCHALSFPRWIAQDITNGWLPIGLGLYRYGFIPKTLLSGTMRIKETQYAVKGDGYYEHVWGDFSFENPLSRKIDLKRVVFLYGKLFRWWKNNHRITIPRSLSLSSENNPFGYDWFWATCDNGWSLFYGNVRFWVSEGPAVGILILTKDGKHYTEFCNISFKYNQQKVSKIFDFYFPTDIELIAKKGEEQLHLRCRSFSETMEGLTKTKKGKYWKGYVICEIPCTIEGNYKDNTHTIPLQGLSKFESHRLVSVFGHHSLKFDICLPPKGFGFSSEFVSHFFKKKVSINLMLLSRPKIQFDFRKINTKKPRHIIRSQN